MTLRWGLWEGLWWMVHLCYMWSPPGWLGLEVLLLRWHLRSCLVLNTSLCFSRFFSFSFITRFLSFGTFPCGLGFSQHGGVKVFSSFKEANNSNWRVTPLSFLQYLYWSKQTQGPYIQEGGEINSTPPWEYTVGHIALPGRHCKDPNASQRVITDHLS